ncbi:hypothetical protein [Metabacillus sediminilitoris]|nr:hypothetical protein [Metabacillus sediminilitoris]
MEEHRELFTYNKNFVKKRIKRFARTITPIFLAVVILYLIQYFT